MSGGFPAYTIFTFNNQTTGQFNLVNGNYRVELDYDPTNTSFSQFHGWWNEQSFSYQTMYRYGRLFYKNNCTVGGIRVKEIKDYDPVSNKINSTKYKYNLFADSTWTSGLLISPVIVSHSGICADVRVCQMQQLSTSSHYPLSSEGGGYVVYPQVRTYEDNNGYTDREYSFSFDGVTTDVSAGSFPTVAWPDSSWKRGKLVLEKIYDNNKVLLHKSSSLGYAYNSTEWTSPSTYYAES